jgi:hypothetical protein
MRAGEIRRERFVLGALVAACLAAFLATIPLPRVDGELLGTDGVGYYAYLPSLALDHDLDFANQYDALDPWHVRATAGVSPTGRSRNLWPIGPAVLWLPFFLVAHGLALVLNAAGAGIGLDGAGFWHQAFVISGNILYGGAAILFAHEIARKVGVGSASGLWSTVTVALAGNLAYYMSAEPSMAHPVSAFAVSAFYLAWIRHRGGQGPRRAAVLGALVGMIALVRPQDVVLTLVPLAEDAWIACRNNGAPRAPRLRARLLEALLMAGVALTVYSPQFAVNQALFGTWWKPVELYAGAAGVPRVDWSSPHLLDVLVSARRGLFAWHPVYALGLLGVVPLWKKDRAMAVALIAGVASQAYIMGCWFDWWQGRAFGGRAFIACFPLVVVGLAALVEAARDAVSHYARLRRFLLAAACLLLVGANGLLAVEYRFAMAYEDRPATWRDLGPRRVSFFIDKCRGVRAGTTE